MNWIGALGDLSDQLGEVGEHLADAGGQLVDGLVPLDLHVLGEVALGGGPDDVEEAIDLASQFGGLLSIVFGNLGFPLLAGLLFVEERLHAVGEMSQGVLAGDLKLFGVVALGDAAQDFEHAVDPGLHRFDRGVDDLGHLRDFVAAGGLGRLR